MATTPAQPHAALPPTGSVRQLRLAVVLYGGVSLAIYMHGSTKELHRLVEASARSEEAGVAADMSPVQRVYLRLLEARREHDGVPTRVVVDVISGTSAGGINGVYLAKALAHDRSQDALRDLWLSEGDIDRLLWGPDWFPRRLKMAIAFLRAPRHPVLKGDRMSSQLMKALEAMDVTSAPGRSLMPPAHELDLIVTTTDFEGSPRQVLIDDPRQIADRAHRAVLRFRYEVNGADDLSRDRNPVLAFAARATSCFPGAFPPVKFAEFREVVGAPASSLTTLAPDFARRFGLAGVNPDQVWFIDGGVLDNRPFGHAIDAFRRRPSGTEVDRKLLYLEPDPARDDWLPKHEKPGQLGTILGAISGIPRHEPILDDLLRVARLNERVWRVRRVIETNFDAIVDRVSALAGLDLGNPGAVTPEQLTAWEQELRDEASSGTAGLSHATYLRLRISAAVDRYADAARNLADFPEDSSHAQLVRAVFRYWVGDRLGLLPESDAAEDESEEARDERERHLAAARDEFLRHYDLDYVERVLRFLLAGISWYYRDLPEERIATPTRERLDHAKRVLYATLDDLLAVTRAGRVPQDVVKAVLATFPDEGVKAFLRQEGLNPRGFATGSEDQLRHLDDVLRTHVRSAHETTVGALYETVIAATDGWPAEVRRRYLVRYLGFPLWDTVLFPIQTLGEVDERDQIEVQRWSPGGRRMLPWTGEGPKLVGTEQAHFGAFLDRDGRQRDYLWGRLDACERLAGLLVPGGDEDPAAYEPWFTEAALAILEEEEGTLPGARDLIGMLRAQLGATFGPQSASAS